MSWQPSASTSVLQQRAEIINQIRQFFLKRGILEVETPLLAKTGVTDPNIHCITAEFELLGTSQIETCYLQTSPEYAMKRLLAAGSGSIFQICKAFRNGEIGRKHNPEFTMLEWYRIGFSYQDLMQEVDELLQLLFNTGKADRLSYQQSFINYLGIDPLTASLEILAQVAKLQGIIIKAELTKDDWLNLLFSSLIEPKLGQEKPIFIYNYPASQAALAAINQEDPRVAERFEAFYKGVELANGWHELADAKDQRERFQTDLIIRNQKGFKAVPIDENLLAALQSGLPDCSGVAMGLDRLFMLLFTKPTIQEVISFDYSRV
ncbi:MAG: EF-P lysine aminoacylase GenX [Gammaproteobacteria bacterium RIFCSPHIGHO2_12_FULL_35_23]|nr:MAG: EF-P lysine aminoacylase GenX [Gammaproteobacteria bacterium RIFCSPHIGHO2_12_FULL_35_23]